MATMLLWLPLVTLLVSIVTATSSGMEESVYGQAGGTDGRTNAVQQAPVALAQAAEAPTELFKQLREEDDNSMVPALPDAASGYAENKLYNDYPPKEEHERSFQLKAHPGVYPTPPVIKPFRPPMLPAHHPRYPIIYHGYPYLYGYPLDFRYGYAYGHTFGTDDRFVCPYNGRFYRDFGSFFHCDGGKYTVQFCAPGSKNAPPGHHPTPAAFCNVNIVGGTRPLLLPH